MSKPVYYYELGLLNLDDRTTAGIIYLVTEVKRKRLFGLLPDKTEKESEVAFQDSIERVCVHLRKNNIVLKRIIYIT